MYIATLRPIPEDIGKVVMTKHERGKSIDEPLLPMEPGRAEEVFEFWKSKGEFLPADAKLFEP